jgi:hypothetical protein
MIYFPEAEKFHAEGGNGRKRRGAGAFMELPWLGLPA